MKKGRRFAAVESFDIGGRGPSRLVRRRKIGRSAWKSTRSGGNGAPIGHAVRPSLVVALNGSGFPPRRDVSRLRRARPKFVRAEIRFRGEESEKRPCNRHPYTAQEYKPKARGMRVGAILLLQEVMLTGELH